jgi:hypothetical protein
MDKIKLFILQNDLSTHPGGSGLINRKKFLEIINICKEKGVSIGGFDGFHPRKNGIQIDGSYSPDYSRFTKEEALEEAFKFLSEHPEEDIGYEVVLRE